MSEPNEHGQQRASLPACLEIPHALLNTLKVFNRKSRGCPGLLSLTRCPMKSSTHLPSPTRETSAPLPLRGNSSLTPSETTHIWKTNQRSSVPTICEGWCRPEVGRGNFANSFLWHFLNLPLTRELIWAWALPITSKSALCSGEYLGAMGQGKSWASTFMPGLWSSFL